MIRITSATLIVAIMLLGSVQCYRQGTDIVDLVEDPETVPKAIIYYVTAPKTIRLFRTLPVSITIQNASSPVTVTVDFVRTAWNGKEMEDTVVASSKVVVAQGQTRRVEIQVGSLTREGHELRIEGRDQSGNNFTDKAYIQVERRNYLIFVQTDKPIYKLGDTVRFRVLCLDTNLRPVQIALDVFIYDIQRNLIQQHLQVNKPGVAGQAGFFSGELQLASEAPLGQWTIEVRSSEDEIVTKSISVEEYVLPRFEVQLKTPQYIIMKQDTFEVTLSANYTFGEPVKGRAQIQLEGPSRWRFDLQRDVRLRKNFTINNFSGVATVTVYVSDVVNKTEDFFSWNSIFVTANVTEGTTNVTREADSKSILLQKQAYKLEITRSANTFRPGFPFTFYVSAVQHDGRPIPPTTRKLVVKLSSSTSVFGSGFYDEEIKTFTVPQNGSVEVTVTPSKAARNIFFSARLGKVLASASVGGIDSPSNSFMQIVPNFKTIAVGETARFTIQLTNPFDRLNFTIISKGILVGEGQVSTTGTSAMLNVPITKAMAPRTRLLVYYMRPDSEVVANVIDFEVQGLLQNNVTLSVRPQSGLDFVEPGSNAVIRVQTAPNSFVGMLAMDQSLLLLRSGNDITESEVVSSVQSFDTDTWSFENVFGSSSFRVPQGSSVYAFLEQAGLVVMSNAAIPGNPKLVDLIDGERFPGGLGFGGDASGSGVAEGAPSRPVPAPSPAPSPINRPTDNAQTPAEEPRLRKDFSETFLFETVNIGSNGTTTFTRPVPDTITSWVSSAFSLNNELGLGLARDVPKLRVFRPFFAVLNLPFSIIRGETIELEVLVFNYLAKDQNVSLTLEISGNSPQGQPPATAERRVRFVMVKSQDSAAIKFPVKAVTVGTIAIKATARCDLAGDALVRDLLVKPEGIRQQFNAPLFIDLRKSNRYAGDVLIPLPREIVPGSQKLVYSVIGDLLGPTITNIDRLINLPYGCGEQNMALMAPNVFVMEYLASAGRLDEQTREKLLRNMRQGYQRQLTFKHGDNSYSAFGTSDKSGSTFLTAFVARVFNQAAKHVDIDRNIINGALGWLASKQAANGSFPEVGKVFDRDLQGGAGKGTALTAYVLITLMETEPTKYAGNVQNATRYLEGQLTAINNDPYSLLIVNYALQLAGRRSHLQTSNRLDALATIANGTKFWAKKREVEIQTFGKFIWEYELPSKDIEMTAYGLLSAIKKKDIDGGFPILAWLLSKRNQQGGFQTSQDTVVGLQAIAEFAQLTASKNRKIDIQIRSDGFNRSFQIAEENALVLQTAEPARFSNNVRVTASGRGTALAQVSWIYYVRNATGQSFALTVTVRKSRTEIKLQVCSSFTQSGESNMAVMEINLPSGYQVDEEEVKELIGVVSDLQRVEVEDGQTRVVLYFDKFTRERKCVSVTGYRLFVVNDLEDNHVEVYDYYEPYKQNSAVYSAK